ncbi:MAG: OsmC family peroxiredoxin [Actinomycetota bacterium]
MAIAVRTARTTWQGTLARGKGNVAGDTGALGTLPVTWAARTEEPGGMTSPEELAAAAHSSCFSMALALRLGEHDLTPERLDVSAAVTLDAVDGIPTVVSSAVRVEAAVDGVDEAAFQEIIDEAAQLCPISRLFAGAEVTVEAVLKSA